MDAVTDMVSCIVGGGFLKQLFLNSTSCQRIGHKTHAVHCNRAKHLLSILMESLIYVYIITF